MDEGTSINMIQVARQILGNKPDLLCQHDHLGLKKDTCKLGSPDSKDSKGFGALYGKSPH
jgi:hypothetical protein